MSHTCPLCHDICFCDMDDTDLDFLPPPRNCPHVCEEGDDFEDDWLDDWELDDDEREAIAAARRSTPPTSDTEEGRDDG